MAELAGNIAEVYISAAPMMTSADGALVSGVDNATLRKLAEILDFTQFGDGWRRRRGGIKDYELDLSGNYDPDDLTGQVLLTDPGDIVYVAYMPEGAGSPGQQLKLIVNNWEQSAEATGKQTFSASLACTDNYAPAAVAT